MSRIQNYLGRNLKSQLKKDPFTEKERSVLMTKIKSKKTNFELMFFKLLKNNKIEFKAHPKNIIGHPDLILKQRKVCIFLDSDFWHGWQYPRWKRRLKSDFWRAKIENNRKRDRFVTKKLRTDGWKVLRLWEHTIKEIDEKKLLVWLKNI